MRLGESLWPGFKESLCLKNEQMFARQGEAGLCLHVTEEAVMLSLGPEEAEAGQWDNTPEGGVAEVGREQLFKQTFVGRVRF